MATVIVRNQPIREVPAPTNRAELRRLLGLTKREPDGVKITDPTGDSWWFAFAGNDHTKQNRTAMRLMGIRGLTHTPLGTVLYLSAEETQTLGIDWA